MKGLLDTKPGVVEIVEMDKPVCTDDTMLVKNIYSGISNGTERNVLLGGNYGSGAFPDKCNYQPVATVVECGRNITRFAVGDVVYAGTFPGHVHYHLVREDDLVVKLPKDFDLLEASLLGTISVPFHNTVRASVTASDNVLVLGAGLIGQFAAQAARAHGATVSVADLDAGRLDYAKKLGADFVFDLSTAAGRAAMELQGPYTVAYEFTGQREVLRELIGEGFGAKSVLANRARVLVVAGRDEVDYSFNAAQEKELAILHVHHFWQEDLDNCVRLIRKGTLQVKPLITRVVPFAQAPAVFEILRDRPMELLGTVIDWRDVE